MITSEQRWTSDASRELGDGADAPCLGVGWEKDYEQKRGPRATRTSLTLSAIDRAAAARSIADENAEVRVLGDPVAVLIT